MMHGFFVWPFSPFFWIFPLLIIVGAVRVVSRLTLPPRRELDDDFRDLTVDVKRLYDGKARKSDEFQATVFKLAYRLGGRITVSDVVIETGASIQDSERLMDGMVDGSRIRMEVSDSGIVFYEFPEIMERFHPGSGRPGRGD